MQTKKQINILVTGGSGHWAELNHYPAILKLKEEGYPVRVLAICDILDPKNQSEYTKLQEIVATDTPFWINPINKSEKELYTELTKFHQEHQIDVIIISTNPGFHYFYCMWAAENKVNILCDKPLAIDKNAAFDIKVATGLEKKLLKLKDQIDKNIQEDSRYTFCLPLRRRALTPFVLIADHLKDVHSKTGEGIRYLSLIINGGVHKYPIEFLNGGAHGYLDGFGSLSHSSYHYIDVIAWYLQCAPGNIKKLEVELPYMFRINDYVKTKGYQKLMHIIEENESNGDYENVKIPDEVLNCELDFTFHLKLYDAQDNLLGLISYVNNHTTYTPRLTKYAPEIIEHTNTEQGGRMSQIYLDVHQGALQNWQLIKNDIVFFGNNIQVKGRMHPKLGKTEITQEFGDAYDVSTITPKDLLMEFIKKCGGYEVSKNIDYLSNLDDQILTNKIFYKFYTKIAEHFVNQNSEKKVVTDPYIYL